MIIPRPARRPAVNRERRSPQSSLIMPNNSLFRAVGNCSTKTLILLCQFNRPSVALVRNRAFSLYFPCYQGIWGRRQVRMRLRPPPRSRTFCRDMETREKGPPTAGFSLVRFDSLGLRTEQMAIFGPRSPRRKFPFLAPKRCRAKDFASWLPSTRLGSRWEWARSGLGQTEALELQRPFCRGFAQRRNADAAGKPALDGGLDQSGSDERH